VTTDLRKLRIEDENPAMQKYLRQCQARLEELTGVRHQAPNAEESPALIARRRAALWPSGEHFLVNLGLGTEQAKLVLTGAQPYPLVQAVQRWLKNDIKLVCGIGGTTGRGKTTAAFSVLPDFCAKTLTTLEGEEFHQWKPRALVMEAVELTHMSFYDKAHQRRLERATTVDLLVLDDLGAEAMNEAQAMTLYEAMDRRLKNGKRILFTTNMDRELMQTRLGPRLMRRLRESVTWLMPGEGDREVGK
jgi:hypothetical protein